MLDFTPDLPDSVIQIDGSILEGGGQIVRLSACLSAITGKPCKISNIRANRPKRGLSAQHKASLESLLLGNEIGSESVEIDHKNLMFFDGDTSNKIRHLDIGTAGSVSLVFQTVLPTMLESENNIIQITGGTRVPFSPLIDYFYRVFLPSSGLDKLFRINVKRHGFFPAGGGCVQLNRTIEPYKGVPLTIIEKGEVVSTELMVFSYGKMRNSCQQVIDLLRIKLKNLYNIEIPDKNVSQQEFNAKGGAIGAMLIAKTDKGRVLSTSMILERNQTFAKFTDELAENYAIKCVSSKACIDDHMADQILIIMALAEPGSMVRVNHPISLHAETAIFVIEEFKPKIKFVIDVDEDESGDSGTCRISCVLRDQGKANILEYDSD